ncbi:MAG TPA: AAA family ATPase [Actinomycetota bacterium]|nr:AAA family ATPase [Actinomycetota bacterium]
MPEQSVATLSPVMQSASPLTLQVRRVTGALVGRPAETEAIRQELSSAREGRLTCVTLEGEPGIGKTRLLLAASDLAVGEGFTPIAVTADEELRGPFLLAQALFSSPASFDVAGGSPAETAVQQALDGLMGNSAPGMEGLLPEQKLMRTYDQAAMALRALAAERALALLIDDLQWADEDSLRLLRYVVRANAQSPIFLLLAIRPEEIAQVNEAVTLIADMERMGFVRRLRLNRFSQMETAQYLGQLLGGKVNPASAATMHAQAEGVPFILEELARAYRDTGMVQEIDGVWSLARNADRLVPSAVRTLIQRRAARLPDATKTSLAEAAVLGRSFALRDLRAVKGELGDEECSPSLLAEALAPAVTAGLLVQHPEGSPADYSFPHEQVREWAQASLPAPRKRAIHAAIVRMFTSGGTPPRACLSVVAQHALAAGKGDAAARFSADAAKAAIETNAPEEALRIVERGLPVASTPQSRVELLRIQDDALEMLGRASDRLEGLSDLAALADALGDSHLELEVTLRRAAALRLSKEEDRAAEVARRVRELAAERNDRKAELAACLELGQDLLRREIGEGYNDAPVEADLDGAAEAFTRAEALAEELGDERALAGATRELGTISFSRARAWFVERQISRDETYVEIVQRIASGEQPEQILPSLPIAPLIMDAFGRFQKALDLYERLGDRRGVMASIIALAYLNWGPDIHLQGSARRIEEIRRLATRLKSLTNETDRALADIQMSYGAHVYSLAKVFPDLALSRGEEAFRKARVHGERGVEFAAAGGIALTHLEMGEVEEAERWLGRAASVATNAPTPLRARHLETWRGRVRAALGDGHGMRHHLERAVRLATEQGLPAARCEALARLALESARMGAELGDEELLTLAERSAEEAKNIQKNLPGHPPWRAQADAAIARVALARGEPERAAEAGRSALASLNEGLREDVDLDILLPAARAILAAGNDDEKNAIRMELRLTLAVIAQRVMDEEVRVRWFRGPLAQELTELAGPVETAPSAAPTSDGDHAGLDEREVALLRLITEGKTNHEIAEELRVTEDTVVRELGEIFAKIGASSRAEATGFAFMAKVI